MRTYTVVVTFTVDPKHDDLHSEQVVAEEIRSWLESLRATVRTLSVSEEKRS
jgi:hypothetical protein